MPRKGSCVYSVSELKRLWAAGKTHQEIAAALGCSEIYVAQLRQRHNLPMRRRVQHGPKDVDPTPEEIAERKAEIRARHLEALRDEHPEASRSRAGRASQHVSESIRCYSWDGFRFADV
jgi:hypothetical protein